MAESSDYTPGVWAGHDFKSARAAYTHDVVDRSYSDAKVVGKKNDDLLPDSLKTEATKTLTIITDVTGSMGEWPATMFSKLPYLEHEAKEYLGEDTEICFAAVGDANSDNYPVQAQPYSKGLDLEKTLKSLVVEGGGGGQQSESYELAALYFARNVEMPNATHPILIIIGDEEYYDTISPDQAKRYAKTIIGSRMTTKDLFVELKRKYAVYLIRKPYDMRSDNGTGTLDHRIHQKWVDILDDEHIVNLPKADRVVDAIFGILAKETDRVAYFKEELEGRQDADQVDMVYKSLKTVHIGSIDAEKSAKLLTGLSVMAEDRGDAIRTKSLL